MKKNNILYSAALAALFGCALSSCDSYLDEMPDNRTELDSEDKVVSLITSAYPMNSFYGYLNESMSDNIDDMGERYSQYDSRFARQAYLWQAITEDDNDGVRNLWEDHYRCVASANQALEAIEQLGGPTTTELREAMADTKDLCDPVPTTSKNVPFGLFGRRLTASLAALSAASKFLPA